MKKWLVRWLQRLLYRLDGYLYIYVPKEAFWAQAHLRGEGWVTLRVNTEGHLVGEAVANDADQATIIDIDWLEFGHTRSPELERQAYAGE